MNEKLRVFISHCAADRLFASALYQELKQEDWLEPWLDVENLQPGQNWELEILKAIHHADVALVCLSKNTLPLTGFFKRETSQILDLTRERSEEEYGILLLRLDETPIPAEFAKYPFVDVSGGNAAVVEALRKKKGK
jgi:hypothetical protein